MAKLNYVIETDVQSLSTNVQTPAFQKLRTIVLNGDGLNGKFCELWFVAADVCKIFGITNTSRAVKNFDNFEKLKVNLHLRGGWTNIVSVIGVYKLYISRPRKRPLPKETIDFINNDIIPRMRLINSSRAPLCKDIIDLDEFYDSIRIPKCGMKYSDGFEIARDMCDWRKALHVFESYDIYKVRKRRKNARLEPIPEVAVIRTKISKDIENIIDKYKENGWSYTSYSAYHTLCYGYASDDATYKKCPGDKADVIFSGRLCIMHTYWTNKGEQGIFDLIKVQGNFFDLCDCGVTFKNPYYG